MKRAKKAAPFSMPPKNIKGAAAPSGKKKKLGQNMGGLFGVTAKKPEADTKPPTRAQTRGARMARLSGKLI